MAPSKKGDVAPPMDGAIQTHLGRCACSRRQGQSKGSRDGDRTKYSARTELVSIWRAAQERLARGLLLLPSPITQQKLSSNQEDRRACAERERRPQLAWIVRAGHRVLDVRAHWESGVGERSRLDIFRPPSSQERTSDERRAEHPFRYRRGSPLPWAGWPKEPIPFADVGASATSGSSSEALKFKPQCVKTK